MLIACKVPSGAEAEQLVGLKGELLVVATHEKRLPISIQLQSHGGGGGGGRGVNNEIN